MQCIVGPINRRKCEGKEALAEASFEFEDKFDAGRVVPDDYKTKFVLSLSFFFSILYMVFYTYLEYLFICIFTNFCLWFTSNFHVLNFLAIV